MARTTTDPKPFMVALRLNATDARALTKLAKQWKCSRSEALRKLIRTETGKG
jgi:hypothetical protein